MLEMTRSGRLEFYDNDRRNNTFDYLRSGGEERPYGGIFAVEMRESWDNDDEVDLVVLKISRYARSINRISTWQNNRRPIIKRF